MHSDVNRSRLAMLYRLIRMYSIYFYLKIKTVNSTEHKCVAMIIVLKHNIKYRREKWGCSVINIDTRELKLYNESASKVIELCFYSTSLQELLSKLHKSFRFKEVEVTDFITDLIASNVLKVSKKKGIPTDAELYNFPLSLVSDNEFVTPLAVEIEYTYKCSRHCSYCAYDARPTANTSMEIPNEQWKEILLDLKKSGVGYIRFTGGDPFTRPDFHEILAFADSLNLIISIGTDLSVTEEEDFRILSNVKNLSMVQTTLDGSNPETADKFRGKGNFDKVVAGMLNLSRFKIPYIVGTVLRKSNTHEIYDIGKLVSTYGANGYCFAPLYAAGRGVNMQKEVPSNEDLRVAHLQFRKLVDSKLILPADQMWTTYVSTLSNVAFYASLDDQPHLCRSGDKILRIDPYGKYYVSIKLKQAMGYSDSVIGDATKETLLDVWNKNIKLDEIRKQSKMSSFGNVIDTRTI